MSVTVTKKFIPGPRLIDGTDLNTLVDQINSGFADVGVQQQVVNTAISTAGAGTLTAAGIAGGIITRTGPTAPYTDTTATAAGIIAAVPGYAVGQSWEFNIINTVGFSATIAAGSNVTLAGNTIIPGKMTGRFQVTITSSTAVTVRGLGVFSYNGSMSDIIQTGNVTATSAGSFASSTAVANITGLSVQVTAGGTYIVEGRVNGTADTAAGVKLAFSGTASMSSSNVNCFAYSGSSLVGNTNQTSWGSNILAQTATYSDAMIQGQFVCQTGGTVTLAGAQNASQTTATTVAVGSYLKISRTS